MHDCVKLLRAENNTVVDNDDGVEELVFTLQIREVLFELVNLTIGRRWRNGPLL